jgi:hypothetical protein
LAASLNRIAKLAKLEPDPQVVRLMSQGLAPVADSEPVALFDIDGTLADFSGAMSRQLEKLRNPVEPKLRYDYYTEGSEPPHITARRRAIKRQPGFWANLERLEDGFQLLSMAQHIGYRVMVLSRGPRQNGPAWGEKLEWCRKNLTDDCQVTITEDKGLVYGKVLVDDWPNYIQRWLEWRKRGLVIMPDRPYNEGFEHPQVIRFSLGKNNQRVFDALSDRFDGIDALSLSEHPAG